MIEGIKVATLNAQGLVSFGKKELIERWMKKKKRGTVRADPHKVQMKILMKPIKVGKHVCQLH